MFREVFVMSGKRQKTVISKATLVRELGELRDGLEGDRSAGACLPTKTGERLHDATLDALGFLRKRRAKK